MSNRLSLSPNGLWGGQLVTKRDILRKFCNFLWSEESSHSNAILRIAVSVRRTPKRPNERSIDWSFYSVNVRKLFTYGKWNQKTGSTGAYHYDIFFSLKKNVSQYISLPNGIVKTSPSLSTRQSNLATSSFFIGSLCIPPSFKISSKTSLPSRPNGVQTEYTTTEPIELTCLADRSNLLRISENRTKLSECLI